ncbi:MAG: hypothetical protein AAFY84_18055 [Pseudomonadota bacterium]
MRTDGLAEEIADELLFRTGKALTTGDPNWLDGCFELPQFMGTIEGTRLIKTEDGLREVFESVRCYYEANGVTDIVRTVVSAEFVGTRTVTANYASRLIRSDGTFFRKPYPQASLIRNLSGSWKIVSSSYVILDSPAHNIALLADG